MYNFTVPMALMDYLPVFFFGVSAVLLLRDLYNKMFKGAYALLAARPNQNGRKPASM